MVKVKGYDEDLDPMPFNFDSQNYEAQDGDFNPPKHDLSQEDDEGDFNDYEATYPHQQ